MEYINLNYLKHQRKECFYMTIKATKEKAALAAIVVLSALFNFVNLGIEGYSNQYYAAAVKSMTLNFKNFFFVALDPAGFVTVDKPPLGYWLQTISAKIFGFSGWSILLPQALAGVLSVLLIYHLVKKSFGVGAGLISALCLAVTPVFVAVSRNNTVDNLLVLALLLACWAISIAAEKGNLKYLILSMILVGIGFNIKMLQAYMILPALYILYLFSNKISLKKRIVHLLVGTVVLLAVSLSWAVVVDLTPAADRPYVGSSTNNTELELIIGHNGAERLGGIFNLFGRSQGRDSSFNRGSGGTPPQNGTDNRTSGDRTDNGNYYNTKDRSSQQTDVQPGYSSAQSNNADGGMGNGSNPPDAGFTGSPNTYGYNTGMPEGGGPGGQAPDGSNIQMPSGAPGGSNMQVPSGNGPGGNVGGGLAGTFGNQTPAGITRLFAKNVLSDQIVWFIPLAVLGFLAAAFRERLRFKLDTRRKQALALWFMWFLPEFIYFSYNTGLFHSYYLTMLAAPIAALAGIGIVTLWELYKEGGWKSWLLPISLMINGAVQLLMLYYYLNSSNLIKILLGLLIALCFIPSLILMIMNIPALRNNSPNNQPGASKFRIILTSLAVAGLLLIPATGSGAAMFRAVNGSMPGAGLELLSAQSQRERTGGSVGLTRNGGMDTAQDSETSDLITFLQEHPVNGQSQVVVSSANTAESLTLNSDVYVGSLSGFMGNETVMSLDEFKQLVKSGEVRYVLEGGNDNRGGSNSEIMDWIKQTGQIVSYTQSNTSSTSNNRNATNLYDLISYTESAAD
jgi:4-amino-4-deoxy-L-arabinose transferase and related glycosyltransferases of PMT family